jgi:hypothetical protein
METRKMVFWQPAPDWLEAVAQVHFRPALSMLALLLTPVAVVTGALGAWRFGADVGWTNTFFIADGLLSHWQVWCAFAIGLQAGAHTLKRGVADRELRIPGLRSTTLLSRGREAELHHDEDRTEKIRRCPKG